MLSLIKKLSPTEFESLVHDLTICMGIRNVSWRTPGADGGRDIEGVWIASDPTGDVVQESWYIECKRYAVTVDWPTVYSKVAYAVSNDADVLLMVTTASLSPACKTEISKWNASRRRPSIRHIDGTRIESVIRLNSILVAKYRLGKSGPKFSVSFKTIASILSSLCDSAEAELEIASTSVSADAAFELARLISSRTVELELTDGFSKARIGISGSMPDWVSLPSGLQKRATRASLAFLAYVRYLVRAKNMLVVDDCAETGYFGQIDLSQGSIDLVDDGWLVELALWSQVRYRVTSTHLCFGAD